MVKPAAYLITYKDGETVLSETPYKGAGSKSIIDVRSLYRDAPGGLAVYHLERLIDVVMRHTIPTPDKDHTDWGKANLARKYLDSLQHVTHHKRGGDYTVLGVGKLQVDGWQNHNGYSDSNGEFPSCDNEPLIAYLADDGTLWFRPPSEFNDGRFKEVKK